MFVSYCIAQVDFNSATNGIECQVIRRMAERLFDFIAQRIQSKKSIGNNTDHKGRHETDRIDQAKRQQEAI